MNHGQNSPNAQKATQNLTETSTEQLLPNSRNANCHRRSNGPEALRLSFEV
jgi:hypothetical protein